MSLLAFIIFPSLQILGYQKDNRRKYTFGCVMSQDDQARQLYDWAEEGTIVEIISSDYPPQSELGRRALAT